MIPAAFGLLLLGAVAVRLIDRPIDTEPIRIGELPKPPPPPKIHDTQYNEELVADGYRNHDLGLYVPAPTGWLIDKAERRDLPGRAYDGALVTLRPIEGEPMTGGLISVVRRPADRRPDPLVTLNHTLAAGPGRVVIEQPCRVELGETRWAKSQFEVDDVVARQYAIGREGDVIIVTALIPKVGFTAEAAGKIDSFVGSIDVEGVLQ